MARLATVDREGSIHIVPIVFANLGQRIYFVVDRKKKTGKPLKRIRNLSETHKATLLLDHYSEDWRKLSFLLLDCSAQILGSGFELAEKERAAKRFKEKYPQYGRGDYFPKKLDEAIFVRLEPNKAVFWQNLRRTSA